MIVVGVIAAPSVARADVLINEVLPNPAGIDSGLEWVEIVNNGAGAVNLNNWLIEKSTSGNFTIEFTFPNVTIQPGEYLVVGEDLVTGADLNLAAGQFFAFGNATATGDAIHLCDDGFVIIDTLVYGPNNNDGFDDDTGGLADPAPAPLEDESVARMPDATDTDDSSVDFVVDPTPTLGDDNATQPPAPGPTITGASPGLAGQDNTWDLADGPASATVVWIWGASQGATPMGGACAGVDMGITNPKKLGNSMTDATGASQLVTNIPAGASGKTMHVQAVVPSACEVSNVAPTAFP